MVKMRLNNALQDKIKQVKIRQSSGYALRASEQQVIRAKQNKARYGKARQGKIRQGKAKQNEARQSKARQNKARRGNLHEVTNGDKKTE